MAVALKRPMANGMLSAVPAAPVRMRYASILRCLGQFVEEMELKALEIKTHGEDYVVQAWSKGPAMTMDLDKHLTPADVQQLEAEGRAKRKAYAGPPNMLSLSQVLRLAGNYVDRLHGRLVRVSWQDQSEMIQAITVQWQASHSSIEPGESSLAVIDELAIHIYKQRKKMKLVNERQAHRPFVSVPKLNPAK